MCVYRDFTDACRNVMMQVCGTGYVWNMRSPSRKNIKRERETAIQTCVATPFVKDGARC